MPHSDNSNVHAVVALLQDLRPSTVLDVGAGAGKYGRLVRQVLPAARVEAIEVWVDYISQFSLTEVYDVVWTHDVRVCAGHDNYDLVIFGDVLEHMTVEEALDVWDFYSGSARIISIPIIPWPQGHEHGNPYEEHITEDWTVESVIETFDVELVAQSDLTAVFIRRT